MPIHGVSDARILPRLGTIRLGVKLERPGKTPISRATDYFVVPHEIQQYVGEQPRELAIMFPSDDMDRINSTIALIRGFTRTQDLPQGRIAYIPLTLAIGPLEVSPPGTGRKTIHILHLKTGVKLADVIRRSLLPPGQVVMPEPVVEEAPEDLTTPEVVALEEGKEEQERGPPPEEDLFGLEQERQEWQKVRKLMADCRMNEKTGWFPNWARLLSYLLWPLNAGGPLGTPARQGWCHISNRTLEGCAGL